MTRCVLKFKSGETTNIRADLISVNGDFIEIWNGSDLSAMVRPEVIDACFLIKKEEVKPNV